MAKKKKWISKAIKRPGALTRKAKRAGMSVAKYAAKVRANPNRYSAQTVKQANLAKTLKKMRKRKKR